MKRVGPVMYADGPRTKVSKKTWLIHEIGDDETLYYLENGELRPLTLAPEIKFLVVGDEENGIREEFLHNDENVVITDAPVGEVYEVLKDISQHNWKKGELVRIHGKVSKETLENGYLVLYKGTKPHQHVLVVVDPVKAGLVSNKPNHG